MYKNSRLLYELGLLCGVFFYKDERLFGYLKKQNFKNTFFGQNIYDVCVLFAKNDLSVIEKIRRYWPDDIAKVYAYLKKILDLTDIDSLGVNTPLYSLMILQEDMREFFLSEMQKMQEQDLLYQGFVNDVWFELKDKKDFMVDDATAVVLYFESVGYVDGAERLSDVIVSFNARIMLINQSLEKESLIRRLSLYLQKDNETVELFNKIKHELQKL